MRVVGFILRILVGLFFLTSAIPKFTGGADEVRADLEIATWFWQLTGVVELVGALALLASLWYVRLALAAGVWLVGLMIGALVAHVRVGDPVSDMVFPAVLLILSAVIATLAWQRAGIGERAPAGDQAGPPVDLERKDSAA